MLSAFLAADDETEAERALAELLERQAQPLARRILWRLAQGARAARLDPDTVRDLCHQVILCVLGRLRTLRSGTRPDGIANFQSYVAATTYRAYYKRLRERYPERHQLKNRLRHLLFHTPSLGLWNESDGSWWAGLARWRGQRRGRPAAVESMASPLPTAFGKRPVEFLVRLFESAGAPVEFDRLVDRVAEMEGRDESRAAQPLSLVSAMRVPAREDAVAQAHHRILLQEVWAEVGRLDLRHRKVLLLNLGGVQGRDLIELFPLTGVASLRQIAEAVDMPATELARLWGELPLDDLRLADMMGLTRQQVINLRATARRQLLRRLKLDS